MGLGFRCVILKGSVQQLLPLAPPWIFFMTSPTRPKGAADVPWGGKCWGPGVCLHAQIYGSSYVPPLHLSFLAGTQSLEIPSLQFVKIKQYAACKMLDT